MKTIDKRNDQLRFAFMAGSVLMAALICARVARSRVEPLRAENVVAHASLGGPSDTNAVEPHPENHNALAEALKAKNLFVKQPKKEHPVKEVDGILGDEALIGEKWYKVGDKIGDAEIVSIEPTRVTIQWDGKDKAFAPLASSRSDQSSPPSRPTVKSRKVRKPGAPQPASKSEDAHVEVVGASAQEDPLAWMGIDLPPKAREKIMEMWNSASEEERAKAKEQWMNMPEEEKQQAIMKMESM